MDLNHTRLPVPPPEHGNFQTAIICSLETLPNISPFLSFSSQNSLFFLFFSKKLYFFIKSAVLQWGNRRDWPEEELREAENISNSFLQELWREPYCLRKRGKYPFYPVQHR